MNIRSQDQLQCLPASQTDSGEGPAEGSLLWAAAQLHRIARLLEDMQARQQGGTPPAPAACPVPDVARESLPGMAEQPLCPCRDVRPDRACPEVGHVVQ